MNIKIGLIESPRELVINSELSHDEAVKLVKDVLGKADDVVELADAKGRKYLVRTNAIAYVEVGSSEQPIVGFGGSFSLWSLRFVTCVELGYWQPWLLF